MISKRLKIVAIIFVSILCLALLFLILYRSSLSNYYSQEDKEQLIAVLSNSNITIDESVIPNKKVVLPGYSSDLNIDSFKLMLFGIYQGITINDTSNSVSFKYKDGTWNIHKNLAFKYENDSFEGFSCDVIVQNEIQKIQVTSVVKDFLNYKAIQTYDNNRNGISIDIELYKLEKQEGTENYKAYFGHKLGDMYLNNLFYVMMQDGNVKYIEGEIVYVFPKKQYSCENSSIVNILIEEKRYIDSIGNSEARKIINIQYGYEAISSESNETYYLPICFLVYDNEEVRTYDYVTSRMLENKNI